MHDGSVVFKAGARPSALARIQTQAALRRLEALLPAVRFEMVTVSSPGDRDRQIDLRESPADFFTQDLDTAVLEGTLDCAVHSAKDMPAAGARGVDWCWLPWRGDPRDVLVLRPGASRDTLPPTPRIGVSSDRREAWCRKAFPGAEHLTLRGNIEMRLDQLDAGDFDAIVMASAALIRLGLEERITEWIPLAELPVPDGQGVLALSFRADDPRFQRLRSLMVKPVIFAGAGVGAADLCTQAGIDALRGCDVCLHDTLMDPALLDYLPASAICFNVGKQAGAHHVPQEKTTRLILDYARRGLRVVRLKGGDPCVFGRLAEEVEALDARRMPYRVIPGISSLSVMGASTGILLTRRGVSKGFTVMSGRRRGGMTQSVRADDRLQLPMVLFMSLTVLPELLVQLRDEGLPDTLPAAVVLETGTPWEQVLRGTVGTIVDQLQAETGGEADGAESGEGGGKRNPAGLVVIGDVARYGFSRAWGALQGRRVLLTCSDALQSVAAREVRDAGGVSVSLPLIRLVPAAGAEQLAERVGQFDWLVITSPSAVRCLLAAMRTAEVDIRTLPHILACGPGTCRELRVAGIQPAAVPERHFGGRGTLEVARKRIGSGKRVLRVRSDKAGPALAEALRESGIGVEDVCLYRNMHIGQAVLPPCEVVFFASSSAVAAFIEAWGIEALSRRTVLAIGQPTAAALADAGVARVRVSDVATVKGAMACLAADAVSRALGAL